MFWGYKHISLMCIKPSIFNFILKFMPNIWGWKHISGMCIKPTNKFSYHAIQLNSKPTV